jgi:hypothetical protein
MAYTLKQQTPKAYTLTHVDLLDDDMPFLALHQPTGLDELDGEEFRPDHLLLFVLLALHHAEFVTREVHIEVVPVAPAHHRGPGDHRVFATEFALAGIFGIAEALPVFLRPLNVLTTEDVLKSQCPSAY